ncbi:MAG: metallophosphoesterase [bacterium]
MLLLLSSQASAFKFAVMGDIQGGDEILKAIISRINAQNDICFVVQTGDMCSKASVGQFDHYLGMMKGIKVPIKHVCGNHDRSPKHDLYEKYLGKAYYSWDYEDSHFAVFDNSRDLLDEAQFQWLKKDLAESKAGHKYVFCHRPVYSPYSKHRMGEIDPRAGEQAQQLTDIFSQYKVTAVISGHIHAFREEDAYKGVKYYVTGGAGARLYHIKNYHAVHHYLIVDTRSGEVKMIEIK